MEKKMENEMETGGIIVLYHIGCLGRSVVYKFSLSRVSALIFCHPCFANSLPQQPPPADWQWQVHTACQDQNHADL